MAKVTVRKAIELLSLCCVVVLISGSEGSPFPEPGGKSKGGDSSSEDLIAVVKVGKTYYSNEPLTEDGRGVLYPVPDRLLGALGLPKPSGSGSDSVTVRASTTSPRRGYTEAEEMKLSLSETRRPAFTTTRQPERGYIYKKPEIPFKYPDEDDVRGFESEREPDPRQQEQDQIDSNELNFDDLSDREAGPATSSRPNANSNSRPNYVAKDIPTFDTILRGAGVEDDLREGDEFTGFQTRPSSSSSSSSSASAKNSDKLGTQAQFFTAGIRDILKGRNTNGNGNGNGDRVAAESAQEFDRFALFVPSNEVGQTRQASGTPRTTTEYDEPSSTTTARHTTTRRTTTSTATSTSTATDEENETLDPDSLLDLDDLQTRNAYADGDLDIDQGYGARERTPRPRTRQQLPTPTTRRTTSAKTTTTTEEPVQFEAVSEHVVQSNELEQLESPVNPRGQVQVQSEPEPQREHEVNQIVTTVTHGHVAPGHGVVPTVHVAPTIDLSGQLLPNNMNDIMRQIYSPIQQQLPFIPFFDSIQPSVYLPFMPQQHQVQQQQHHHHQLQQLHQQLQPQPQFLMQMQMPHLLQHVSPAPVQLQQSVTPASFDEVTLLREALLARAQERPAPIETVYERGNGHQQLIYGRDIANEVPLNALRAQEYDFSTDAHREHRGYVRGQVIDESIRAETYLSPYKAGQVGQKEYGESHYYSPRDRETETREQLPKAPEMVRFTPEDAMTRRPPTDRDVELRGAGHAHAHAHTHGTVSVSTDSMTMSPSLRTHVYSYTERPAAAPPTTDRAYPGTEY